MNHKLRNSQMRNPRFAASRLNAIPVVHHCVDRPGHGCWKLQRACRIVEPLIKSAMQVTMVVFVGQGARKFAKTALYHPVSLSLPASHSNTGMRKGTGRRSSLSEGSAKWKKVTAGSVKLWMGLLFLAHLP